MSFGDIACNLFRLTINSLIYLQGCEIWTRPYGPTGLTGNHSLVSVFNSQELAYTRKEINRAKRGRTSWV